MPFVSSLVLHCAKSAFPFTRGLRTGLPELESDFKPFFPQRSAPRCAAKRRKNVDCSQHPYLPFSCRGVEPPKIVVMVKCSLFWRRELACSVRASPTQYVCLECIYLQINIFLPHCHLDTRHDRFLEADYLDWSLSSIRPSLHCRRRDHYKTMQWRH